MPPPAAKTTARGRKAPAVGSAWMSLAQRRWLWFLLVVTAGIGFFHGAIILFSHFLADYEFDPSTGERCSVQTDACLTSGQFVVNILVSINKIVVFALVVVLLPAD